MNAAVAVIKISIHAPRVGGDGHARFIIHRKRVFQSTPPVWGATRENKSRDCGRIISIHAPRVGGDVLALI